jgi:Spy/CpxP family protein refolding chaperone
MRGIELTDAQKTQLQTLRTKQREERQALVKQIRADGQRPDSAERAQVRQLAERQRTQVRALLTPAQQQQFDKNLAERKQRGEERGARRGRARRA